MPEGPLTAAAAGAAFAALILLGLPASAEGDPAAGERVFRKCQSCHQLGPDAANRVGPVLNGIVGAPAAQGDYAYSDALAASGLTWDEATLTDYLRDPKALVDGTKMTFAGLRKDEEIADVIAYLATWKEDGTQN